MSGGLAVQSNCLFFTRTREKKDRREGRENGRGRGRHGRQPGTVRAGSARSGQNSGSEGGERELGVVVLYFLM